MSAVVAVLLAAVIVAATGKDDGATLGNHTWPWHPGDFSMAERIVVNLDDAPSVRWRHVALKFKDELPKYVSFWLQILENQVSDDLQRQWLQFNNIKDEYMEEIMTFVEVSDHPNVTRDNMILFQLQYELGAGGGPCLDILAAGGDGVVSHAGNLGATWKAGPIVDIDYQSQGRTLFTASTFVGSTGVFNGMRLSPASWSIKQSPRAKGWQDATAQDVLYNNLNAAKAGATPSMYALRTAMKEISDFREAVNFVVTAPLVAPAYYLIAGSGPYQGALVTKDRPETQLPFQSVQTLSPAIDSWFLVMANIDAWAPSPGDGDLLSHATLDLQELGQEHVTMRNLVRILRTPPVGTRSQLMMQWLGIPSKDWHRTILAPQGMPSAGPELHLSVWNWTDAAGGPSGPRALRQAVRLAAEVAQIGNVSNAIHTAASEYAETNV